MTTRPEPGGAEHCREGGERGRFADSEQSPSSLGTCTPEHFKKPKPKATKLTDYSWVWLFQPCVYIVLFRSLNKEGRAEGQTQTDLPFAGPSLGQPSTSPCWKDNMVLCTSETFL